MDSNYYINKNWDFMANEQILRLLKRVLPKLIENPKLMFGHDTNSEEVDYVVENGKISISTLENLGGDHFFVSYAEKFGMTEEEGKILDFYLENKIREEEKDIKKIFPFIV